MAEFPALPLFTDAVIADCNHLTDEEFGAYMRILIVMWRSPGCKIPFADAWLMRRMGGDASKYNELYKPLLQEFCYSDGSFWMQKRLLKEYRYVMELQQKRRGAAKSRWEKETPPMQNACTAYAPTPTPIPTPTKEKKPPIVPQAVSGKNQPDRFEENFERFWSIYPRRTAKPAARKAFAGALKKIPVAELGQAVRAFAASCKDKDPKYIPHPATWLNQERWADDGLPKLKPHDPDLLAIHGGLEFEPCDDGLEPFDR